MAAPLVCEGSAVPPRPPAGDLLIVMAQVIVAIQMVLEEKFVYKHDVHPLQAVGTEGLLRRGAGRFLGGGANPAWGELFFGGGSGYNRLQKGMLDRNHRAGTGGGGGTGSPGGCA